ncbi:terpenoid synthase [Dichomitus squalens LYAD-421 SS1]|uniref:Terpene synthase n=2 Tax=Dichomitus squalens TaxID=114155 RepID=A0A4Q9MIW2_9APHY|nr:terpenoid synthase [Dichomitus squalens LYAD-421 SS1]EJF61988.1 terpenoid synthase [Dichomitus squalens LYAD-421 SS1]TBU27470.1 terpenoid synthase [Dichomitus squalens]
MGSIRIPNFPAFCSPHFELRCNAHCHTVTLSSEKWALANPLFLDADEESRLTGARLGLLAALCFPTCDAGQLLSITKFLIILVHWTDKPRSLYADEEIFDPVWTRAFRPTTRRDWQKRFQRHLAAFRLGQAITARNAAESVVPDLESYIAIRRDACGVKMLLDLIIYAGGLVIPPQIYDHPILRRLRQDAGNIIAWATDIAAYARHPRTSNIVTVVMTERKFAPQGAVHFAGNLIKETFCTFLQNESQLPMFGDWDDDVRAYVRGLRDCVVGSLHWLYETDRFFGEVGEDVRTSGWVFVS